MLKEFKDFIAKGNVVDMGVAVVIGAAFGAIVTALVDNILMPLIGALTAGVNFSAIVVNVAGVELGVGIFINALIKFIIIAFCMFLIVKAVNKLRRPKPEEAGKPEPPAPSKEEILLTEIRDLLKK